MERPPPDRVSRPIFLSALLGGLLLGGLIAPTARAEVSAATRAYTRGAKDPREIWKKAREAFDRAAWDDAAALGEAVLRLGREHPRVLLLIARCRVKAGAPDAARPLVQRALELKPGDPDALALERELGGGSGPAKAARTPTTLAARLFGAPSSVGREALEAYYQDRLEDAQERAGTALSSDPGDPAALFAMALIHRDRHLPEDAARSLEFLRGRFPGAAFLEFLGAARPDPLRERAFYAEVERDPAPDPIALALLARYKRVLLQSGAARRILKRAVDAVEKPDRETLLAISDAALELQDPATSRAALDEYKALFGEDAWFQVATADLMMHLGKPEEAARLGAAAYRKEPHRMLVLPRVMRHFNIAGKESEMLELLDLAAKTFPDRKDIAGSFQTTAQLWLRKLSLRSGEDGIFHLSVQANVPGPVVARVLSTFKEAHRKVGALFNYFPQRVRLVIFDQIITMPGALAYFSPFDDTIYVGGVHYQPGDEKDTLTARTVSEHEFTHYVQAELQRKKGLEQRVYRQVKWLSEGLAEWASDGLTWRIQSSRDSVRAALQSGTVPLPELESPAVAASLDGQIKAWYLQGHMMVKYLLERDPDRAKQLDRLIAFSLDLTRGEDLDDALKKRFDIDSKTFEEGYTELIRKEAIRRKQ